MERCSDIRDARGSQFKAQDSRTTTSPVRLYLSFGLFYIANTAVRGRDGGQLKIIDNTERENEVRKIEIR